MEAFVHLWVFYNLRRILLQHRNIYATYELETYMQYETVHMCIFYLYILNKKVQKQITHTHTHFLGSVSWCILDYILTYILHSTKIIFLHGTVPRYGIYFMSVMFLISEKYLFYIKAPLLIFGKNC